MSVLRPLLGSRGSTRGGAVGSRPSERSKAIALGRITVGGGPAVVDHQVDVPPWDIFGIVVFQQVTRACLPHFNGLPENGVFGERVGLAVVQVGGRGPCGVKGQAALFRWGR
jgi:hypothetical protein